MPCQPCTPPQDEFPIFCDPNPATDVGQRLLVEDEAFCTKALVSPETGSTLVWEDGIKWSSGASGSFTSNDGKTITVANGIITSIV